MRVIVIGAGEVGSNLVRIMAADGHDVTVVDSDAGRCAALQTELDALVVNANGASPRVLRNLRPAETGLLAAVTAADEANIIAALAGRALGAKRTVARVRDPDYFEAHEPAATDVLGIDFVIDPDRAAAFDIAEAIRVPGAVSVEWFGDGQLGLAEVIVTDASSLAGVELALRERPEPTFVVGIVRGGRAQLSSEHDVIEEGDHILVVAPRENLAKAVARFSGRPHEVHECVIFGGGRIGERMARVLEDDPIRVTMLERDPERAQRLAELLPSATILLEEGVSEEALTAQGIDRADAFVACAGEDRSNLLAALTAKRLGIELCLSVVSREEFVPLVDALHIDAAFSPRLIAAEAIIRFVHTEQVRAMHFLRNGLEALEVEVDSGSRIAGSTLGDTHGMLRGCRVGGILREGRPVIPYRGHRIEAGDRVLMLGRDGALSAVEPVFSAGR